MKPEKEEEIVNIYRRIHKLRVKKEMKIRKKQKKLRMKIEENPKILTELPAIFSKKIQEKGKFHNENPDFNSDSHRLGRNFCRIV
jgi:phosphopantothenoylcysteine synthetase/decarboxylase